MFLTPKFTMGLDKKYNFSEAEKKWQDFWAEKEIYKFHPEQKGKIFSVDTPPPYVSAAHLHVGHAMSYTQAEFVVRYKRMRGFNVFYPMGFDDNGLPTERFVEKKYKIDKNKITKKEFVDLCLKETAEGGKVYKDFFTKLGISVDWSLLYSTINEHSQRIAQKSFIDLYKKGEVKYENIPVIWCPYCQTALSQADLDDQEQNTKLNYINFQFTDNTTALIATTRPELIPACVALYTNSQDKRYGKYIGQKARVPLFDYEVPVLADDNVDPEFGTGLMMVCTWGDGEDVERWRHDKLETKAVINKDGRLSEVAGPYQGLNIKQARERILEDLKNKNLLVKQEDVNNVVNIHERCGTIAEFIITPQWAIKVADKKKDWTKRGKELNWFPEFMKSKYDAWVEGLKWDWTISRQRYYGVPFPVWHCQDCQTVMLPNEDQLPVDPVQTPELISECYQCGGGNVVPEKDVMDTWMTSSVTPLINAYWKYGEDKNLMDKIYPMTLRVQAFEIIRTWLFYSVVKGHYHTDSLPWRDAMISGWGLDEQGKKISKSLGNFIDPQKIIDNYSADSLRFWAASANLGQNLRYNEEEVKIGKKTVNKIWNAAKFVISHLENYTPAKVDLKILDNADKWILHRLNQVLENYIKAFDVYEYSQAKKEVNSFFWNDFADYYLEFVKYRVYNDQEKNSDSFQAAQHTLYTCLNTIIKMYAPIMPFITEEIYQEFFKKFDQKESIHLSTLPTVDKKLIDNNFSQNFADVIAIVDAVRKYKSSNTLALNAEIDTLTIDSKAHQKFLEKQTEFFSKVLNIKNITFGPAEEIVNAEVKISVKN